MIYDPVDVRISVSNKRHVWRGRSEPPRALPLDPLLFLISSVKIRDTSPTGINTFKFSREYNGAHDSDDGKKTSLKK